MLKRENLHATVLVMLIAPIMGCDRLPFGHSAGESATLVCEERLKPTLTSPSSYQRKWSSFTPAGPVTKAEYVESLEADRRRAVRDGNDADAFSSAFILQCMKNPENKNCTGMPSFEQIPRSDTAFVLIQFEAANAFNAQLPGFFSCRMNAAPDGKYEERHIFTSLMVPEKIGQQLKSQAELVN